MKIRQTAVWLSLGILGLLAACGPEDRPRAPDTTSESASKSGTASREADAALISAAQRGDVGAVERLLDEGASVEARDDGGRTALVAASYGNHLGVAKTLIEAGADINSKDDTEQSAYLISTAEVGDDPRLLDLTLENGADVRSLDSYNGTGLIRAADRGYVRVVERLLETDTDIDHVNDLGWTALLEAIILGDGDARHTEVVRTLVEAGADVNIADRDGVTPLQHARERGYGAMVEILRDTGAR
ncbi:MAG TPA: ankyrin repeat domain-containing protein [Rubrobacteraceae bacterium]|nr:ankyrin repeat domain-containing protein [Rubrobacteraceae bacterium]